MQALKREHVYHSTFDMRYRSRLKFGFSLYGFCFFIRTGGPRGPSRIRNRAFVGFLKVEARSVDVINTRVHMLCVKL